VDQTGRWAAHPGSKHERDELDPGEDQDVGQFDPSVAEDPDEDVQRTIVDQEPIRGDERGNSSRPPT
jgi:hypothetical protein